MPGIDIPESNLFPSLGQREFEEIRAIAYRSFGLDLKPGKEELVSARLQRLVRAGGFRTYHDYCRHVLRDTTGESLHALIDALATNHTSFLREPDHFRFLQEQVVASWKSRRELDIWSAACSTGEEVWTLAFVLRDVLPAAQIRLIGTDISRKALAEAEHGQYPADKVATLPPNWLKAYFQPQGRPPQSYRILPAVRSNISFRRLNLIEPFSWPRPFAAIFCRNLMIYFDRNTQHRLVAQLAANLEPGGYLFIGHSESLNGIEHPLQYIRPAVYRKPASGRGKL